MKRIFACADRYLQSRDWKMAAVLKFCLCSLGVLLGLLVPGKHKKTAAATAGAVFCLTYVPLMADFLTFGWNFFHSDRDREKTE